MPSKNKDACHKDSFHFGTYFRPREFEDFWNKGNSEDDCDFGVDVDYDKLALGFPALNVQKGENKHPDLSIAYTCRQISEEAMELYYAENHFVFCLINFGAPECSMTSANAAWSFLQDRPRAMLSRIRHIDLYLFGWDEYDGFQILDPQVWRNLIDTIKSKMKLRHLGLHFRGRLADLRDGDATAEPMTISDGEDSNQHARVTELAQLPHLSRLTIHFSGFREPQYYVVRHKHRRACFTAHKHEICHNADSALQFAALVRVLRSNLLPNGGMLGYRNIRAQLVREPEPVVNDIESQHWETRPDEKTNYFLSMLSDDDGAGNCLLPRENGTPSGDEDGMDQAQRSFIDIFGPLGDSASLDRVKTRGKRSD